MISLKSKITKAVLGYFMLHQGAELYVNEMARRFSLDDGNLSRKLLELEKAGILKSRERGKERYYSLDLSFPLLREYKQIILKTLGFEQFLKDSLKSIPGIHQAYLFGSYARDKMDVASDIDLAVIGSHNTLDLQKAVANLQKQTDREINVISLSPEEYKQKLRKDSFFQSLEKKKKIRIL